MFIETFEELKLHGEMPSPSGVGMRVLEITRQDGFSTSELADTIRADAALTGRILKLANSAGRAAAEPVTTVSEAIMRLGASSVRDLALAFSLVQGTRSGDTRGFDYDLYWGQSLARAVCCQEVSRLLGAGKPEETYICGLLSDIGQLALASVHRQVYARLWIQWGASGQMDALREAETKAFAIHHGQVSTFLLQEWGLPDVFAESIAEFTADRNLEGKEDGSGMATLLCLGEALSHLVIDRCETAVDTEVEELRTSPSSLDQLQELLTASDEEFEALITRCESEWNTWRTSLGIDSESHAELCFRARFMRQQIEEEGASFAGLADDPGDEDPDLFQEVFQGSEPAPGPVALTPSPEVEQPERSSIRVLAIDDDPVSLRLLVRHLEADGYDVLEAKDGREGLKLALQARPDIVMSDWIMPDLDGLELCKELRKIGAGRGIYFLLVTGEDEEDRVVQAFEAGVDDYVTKPFVPRVLSARIKGATRIVRLQARVEADRQTMTEQMQALAKKTRELRAAALTDPMTGLHNRRYAMKRLESEWASLMRTRRPLSVVMLYIDHFKSVNDGYGHDIGDFVLTETARVLGDSVRSADEVCRIGGEEFLAICRNSDSEAAIAVAERLRDSVAKNLIEKGAFNGAVTVSLGVATLHSAEEATIDGLLKCADEAVYKAKQDGRNRVCMGPDPSFKRRLV